jgi:hypothetical protein
MRIGQGRPVRHAVSAARPDDRRALAPTGHGPGARNDYHVEYKWFLAPDVDYAKHNFVCPGIRAYGLIITILCSHATKMRLNVSNCLDAEILGGRRRFSIAAD